MIQLAGKSELSRIEMESDRPFGAPISRCHHYCLLSEAFTKLQTAFVTGRVCSLRGVGSREMRGRRRREVPDPLLPPGLCGVPLQVSAQMLPTVLDTL